jgi:hypothetical protein
VKLILRKLNPEASEDEVEGRAVSSIVKYVQKVEFSKELILLQRGEAVPKQSPISAFTPFLGDGGFIRVGGRLERSGLSEKIVHPIILPRCGSVELMILDLHRQLCHAGTSITLTELRKKGYWISRGRRVVTSILQSCRVCRKFQAAPFSAPEPPLPRERVEFCRPFAVTGVDLFGPLFLRERLKVWIALFTCFQIRAVHLEVVADLSEEAMLRAFRRFAGRRGWPSTVWSDHGTNFVALSKSLCSKLRWRFIVERAPWWGGLWERLIQSTKNLFKRVLGRELLTWDELESVVVDIERVLNKRPISYLWEGAKPSASPVPLTPEDFLLFRGNVQEEQRTIAECLTNEFEAKQRLEDTLRRRWHDEYLISVLGNFGKLWKGRRNRQPSVGEVVLMMIEDKRRQEWPLAVVEELYPGGDGVIRSVRLRIGSRSFSRPIQKLFPLELYTSESDTNTGEAQGNDDLCSADHCLNPKGTVNWIQCDVCEKWFHFTCLNLDYRSVDISALFACPRCSGKAK